MLIIRLTSQRFHHEEASQDADISLSFWFRDTSIISDSIQYGCWCTLRFLLLPS